MGGGYHQQLFNRGGVVLYGIDYLCDMEELLSKKNILASPCSVSGDFTDYRISDIVLSTGRSLEVIVVYPNGDAGIATAIVGNMHIVVRLSSECCCKYGFYNDAIIRYSSDSDDGVIVSLVK